MFREILDNKIHDMTTYYLNEYVPELHYMKNLKNIFINYS